MYLEFGHEFLEPLGKPFSSTSSMTYPAELSSEDSEHMPNYPPEYLTSDEGEDPRGRPKKPKKALVPRESGVEILNRARDRAIAMAAGKAALMARKSMQRT